jgi:hypothetical protein
VSHQSPRADRAICTPTDQVRDHEHAKCLRCLDEATLECGETSHRLQVERQDEDLAEEPRVDQRSRDVDIAEQVVTEQSQQQRGLGNTEFGDDRGDEQCHADHRKPDDERRQPALLRADRHRVQQQPDRTAAEHQAEHIEPARIRVDILAQRTLGEHQREQPDRDVDEEDP